MQYCSHFTVWKANNHSGFQSPSVQSSNVHPTKACFIWSTIIIIIKFTTIHIKVWRKREINWANTQAYCTIPNRLTNIKSNAQMEKIWEMFNQVQINMPLLDAIQQVPSYAKFLKDMCAKKRKINIPKKVFLATNISELLSGSISVKYKDPTCPTFHA